MVDEYFLAASTMYESHYLYSEAEALLRSALAEHEDVKLMEKLCVVLSNQHKYDESLAVEKIISSLGGDVSAGQARIAQVAWLKGDPREAARCLEAMYDLGERDGCILMFGKIVLSYMNAQFALHILNLINPDSIEAASAEAFKAQAYVALNNRAAAQSALEKVWHKDPWSSHIVSARRDFEAGFQTKFTPSSECPPPPPDPWDYSRLPRIPKDKSPRFLFNTALAASWEKRYSDCVDYCNKALALSPTLLDTYGLRGKAHYMLKNYPMAEADFRYVLEYGKGKYNVYGLYVRGIKDIALKTFQIRKVIEMEIALWKFRKDWLTMYFAVTRLFAQIKDDLRKTRPQEGS